MFTNSNKRKDFLYDAIRAGASSPCSIYIASAFFTEDKIIEKFSNNECTVKIIVRLGYPTSAQALERCLSMKNIQIRFFTSSTFHPKLYIFGESYAIVGSANFTHNGLTTNQEVSVKIDQADDRLVELKLLFADYWAQAKVLTKEHLEHYKIILKRNKKITSKEDLVEDEIRKSIGEVIFQNITRDKQKESSENIFIEDYRKRYQEYLSVFKTIESVFKLYGKRKFSDTVIPLRLEIDSFLSFVRDKHTKGDSWSESPLLNPTEQKQKIKDYIDEWISTRYDYFEEKIVHENYPLIKNAFKDEQTFENLSIDNIIDALTVIHSFHDRLRFFQGGLDTLLTEFKNKNDHDKIKLSLSYLVFGNEETEIRMANLIYNPKYKLAVFGTANVQELIGWVNSDGLPIVNGRTTKVMRFLGFDVPQL